MKTLRTVIGIAAVVMAGNVLAADYYMPTSVNNSTMMDSRLVGTKSSVTATGYVDNQGHRSTQLIVRHNHMSGYTKIKCPGLVIKSNSATRTIVVAHKSQHALSQCRVERYTGAYIDREDQPVDSGVFGSDTMGMSHPSRSTGNAFFNMMN